MEIQDLKLYVTQIAKAKVPRRTVVSVEFSPDSQSIACGDNTGILGYRSADNLSLHFEKQAHSDDIRSICFSHDCSRLLTGSADKTAVVWNLADGSFRMPLKGHSDDVTQAIFLSDDRVVTASLDTSVRFWSLSPSPVAEEIKDSVHIQSCIALSPDQKLLAIPNLFNKIRIHSLEKDQVVQELSLASPVSSLAFDHRGEILVYSSEHHVLVSDVSTGDEIHTLSKHADNVLSVCFNTDGTRLATADRDGTTMIWDTATWQLHTPEFKHPGAVRSIKFAGSSGQLITACDDAIVRVWDLESGAVASLRGHNGIVRDVDYSAASRQIASGGQDGAICIWNMDTQELIHKLETPIDVITKVSFNNTGDRLATVGQDGSARIWSATSGDELLTIKASAEPIHWVEFTPDGNTIVVAPVNGRVKLWRSKPDLVP